MTVQEKSVVLRTSRARSGVGNATVTIGSLIFVSAGAAASPITHSLHRGRGLLLTTIIASTTRKEALGTTISGPDIEFCSHHGVTAARSVAVVAKHSPLNH